MKFIICTFNGSELSIVVRNIQAIKEATGERKGKANIIMARMSDDCDDTFHVDQTYREVQMMLTNIEL